MKFPTCVFSAPLFFLAANATAKKDEGMESRRVDVQGSLRSTTKAMNLAKDQADDEGRRLEGATEDLKPLEGLDRNSVAWMADNGKERLSIVDDTTEAKASAQDEASYDDSHGIFYTYFSDIAYASTADAPTLKIGYADGSVSAKAPMRCYEKDCAYEFNFEFDGSIENTFEYFQVEATGGDAMMIDHAVADLYYPDDNHQAQSSSLTWGTANNKFGWCLSTESGDYDGNDYRVDSSCRCRIRFRLSSFSTAGVATSCSSSEEASEE